MGLIIEQIAVGGEGQAGGATKGNDGKRDTGHNHTAEVGTKPPLHGYKVIMDLVIRIDRY